MHKTVCKIASLYCKFCKSIGHYEKDYRAYQLMGDKMVNVYLMKKEEQVKFEQNPPQFQDPP